MPPEPIKIKDPKQAIRYGEILAKGSFALRGKTKISHWALQPLTASTGLVGIRRQGKVRSEVHEHKCRHCKASFDSEALKLLPIPVTIDNYNYGMNAVDTDNQLRRDLSIARPQEAYTWRPLTY